MQLDKATTIVDEMKFVEAHKAVVERNKGNKWFDAYRERLEKYNKLKDGNKT